MFFVAGFFNEEFAPHVISLKSAVKYQILLSIILLGWFLNVIGEDTLENYLMLMLYY